MNAGRQVSAPGRISAPMAVTDKAILWTFFGGNDGVYSTVRAAVASPVVYTFDPRFHLPSALPAGFRARQWELLRIVLKFRRDLPIGEAQGRSIHRQT
jgi:hypothetical protein